MNTTTAPAARLRHRLDAMSAMQIADLIPGLMGDRTEAGRIALSMSLAAMCRKAGVSAQEVIATAGRTGMAPEIVALIACGFAEAAHDVAAEGAA